MSAQTSQVFVSLRLAEPETVGELNIRVDALVQFRASAVIIRSAPEGGSEPLSPGAMFSVEPDGVYLLAWNAGSEITQNPDHCICLQHFDA